MIRKTSIFAEWFDQAKERLQSPDNDALDALGDVLYDMTTIDELHAWLTHRTVSQVMN